MFGKKIPICFHCRKFKALFLKKQKKLKFFSFFYLQKNTLCRSLFCDFHKVIYQ
ncbi:hypothetical protein HMPREF1551_01512 [Capnocytophaga sp. oral taxon 863 str. F0517]|nr:hypothetical protein HMPREF1551_01512 [Capnocytophaga sp. oral taxon 863 str. F0517]